MVSSNLWNIEWYTKSSIENLYSYFICNSECPLVITPFFLHKKIKNKKNQLIPIPLTHACISCKMYRISYYQWTPKMKTNQISALEPTKLLVKADSTWASSLKVKDNVFSLWPVKRQRQRQRNFKDRTVVAHQKVNSATLHQIYL